MSGRQQLAGRAGAVVRRCRDRPRGGRISAGGGAFTCTRAQALADDLGARSAGTYFDAARGAMVVTVTDQRRRRAGPRRRRCRAHRRAQRRRARARHRRARRPPTSRAPPGRRPIRTRWSSRSTTPSTAPSSPRSRPSSPRGDAARVERIAGTLQPLHLRRPRHLRRRLPLLARLQRPQRQHRLLPDRRPLHNIGATWYANSRTTTVLGTGSAPASRATTTASSRYTRTPSRTGNVYLYNGSCQDITAPRNATVGQSVKRSGSTTGLRSGTVTGLNATVNYAAGHRHGPDPHQRLRRARRQRRLALRRHRRARPDLRRQRQLLLRWHDVLPAGHRGAQRLRGSVY